MLKLRLIKINRLSSSVIWLTWTEIRLALSRIISLSVMLLLSIPTNWTIRDWRIIMRWIVYNHGYFIFIFIFRLLIDRELNYQALSSSISHPSAKLNQTEKYDYIYNYQKDILAVRTLRTWVFKSYRSYSSSLYTFVRGGWIITNPVIISHVL